jgi:hypothetical protein
VHISQRLPTTINLGSHPRKKNQLLVFLPLPLPIDSDSSAGIAVTSSDAEHFIVNWFSSRIRLTGQLVRPTLRRQRQWDGPVGLTSRTLSLLLQVSQYFSTSDGPTTAQEPILHAGVSCGIPSIWHSPTTRHPGGNPRRNRRVGLPRHQWSRRGTAPHGA